MNQTRSMHRIGAIIQARSGSARLPGKVLADIQGKPMIVRVVEQVSHASRLDDICVATSTDPSDDALADLCRSFDIDCIRGDLQNVLKRYIDVADARGLNVIVRITGDNPFADPFLIDKMIDLYKKNPRLDYINNAHREGSVMGSGAELVTRTALKIAMEHAMREEDPSPYLEHVTFFIRLNTGLFRTKKFLPDKKLSRTDISYSVDHPEDLALVREIFAELYRPGEPFRTSDILDFLDKNPQIRDMNSHLHDGLPDY